MPTSHDRCVVQQCQSWTRNLHCQKASVCSASQRDTFSVFWLKYQQSFPPFIPSSWQTLVVRIRTDNDKRWITLCYGNQNCIMSSNESLKRSVGGVKEQWLEWKVFFIHRTLLTVPCSHFISYNMGSSGECYGGIIGYSVLPACYFMLSNRLPVGWLHSSLSSMSLSLSQPTHRECSEPEKSENRTLNLKRV